MSENPESETGELFEDQQEAVDSPVRRLFTEYGRDRPATVALAVVGTALAPLVGLVPTYMLKVIIDSALRGAEPYALPGVPAAWIPPGRWEQLLLSAGIVLAAAALSALLGWANSWGWSSFSQHVQHAVRTSAFAKTQRLEMSFFTNQRTGQLLSVLNNDVNQLDDFLSTMVSNLVRISVQFTGIAAILLLMNWQLALVTLVPVPIMAYLSHRYASAIRDKYDTVRERVGVINASIDNSVDGISVVKSYTNEDLENERVHDASDDYRDAQLDAISTRVKFFPTMNFVNWVGFCLLVLVGGYWIAVDTPPFFTGELSLGTLVAFLTYNQQFTLPLIQGGHLLDRYHDARASAVRVFALIDYPLELTERDDPVELDTVEGRVAFDDVSFAYEGSDGSSDESVLDDVSFTADAGQLVGLVGPTGSGKTTLMKLLLRFYDPDEGRVTVDGHDLRDVRLDSLRGAIGYVSQDPFLFDGTVRENIAYADPDADEAAVEAAAKRAGAHEFVVDLDDGYDTQVGERGVKLSGGQRQRLSIARAVLRDPEILVLDEATSHVDNETEVFIQNSLADLIEDRTTFAIAHRLSTVRDADQILVLDDGEIVERGTHENLLDVDGLYANLWRVQVGEVDALPREFVERTAHREVSNPSS